MRQHNRPVARFSGRWKSWPWRSFHRSSRNRRALWSNMNLVKYAYSCVYSHFQRSLQFDTFYPDVPSSIDYNRRFCSRAIFHRPIGELSLPPNHPVQSKTFPSEIAASKSQWNLVADPSWALPMCRPLMCSIIGLLWMFLNRGQPPKRALLKLINSKKGNKWAGGALFVEQNHSSFGQPHLVTLAVILLVALGAVARFDADLG